MRVKEAITIIENEIECVKRANICDRDCAKCDLVKEDKDILAAYNMAIGTLKVFEETDLHDHGKCDIIWFRE